MARPRRRVLILLSIRIGVSLQQLEELDAETIRQYLVMLCELNKPRASQVSQLQQQTPEQMQAAIMSSLGHLKG